MILVPMLLVASYIGWQIYKDFTSVEASRQFVRIDYTASSRRGRRR
ncbi:MAG: hypothetical protein WBM54_00865 [Woeseia sp.]